MSGAETEGAGERTRGDPKCGWGWGSDGAVGVQTLEAGNPGDSQVRRLGTEGSGAV